MKPKHKIVSITKCGAKDPDGINTGSFYRVVLECGHSMDLSARTVAFLEEGDVYTCIHCNGVH